jgi:integrase
MATVVIHKRKLKSGVRYPIYFKDPATGTNRYFKTFRRQKEAQQAANDLRSLLDAGKVSEIKSARRKISLLCFKEVSDSLKVFWKGRLARSEIRPTTFENYCDRLKLVEREFGKRLLCEISQAEILEYRNKVASDTSSLASNRSVFVMKQVFKHGMRLNAVKDDPIIELGYLSEKAHVRNRFLGPSELDHLLLCCKEARFKKALTALILLGAEHGASKQECLDLQWSDIDFDFEGVGLIAFYRTKNRQERTVYLMPRTKQALLEWRKHQEWMRHRKGIKNKGPAFVFSRLDGRPLGCFNKSWRKVCEIGGFPELHFHDLRHTFCSNLLLSGADLRDVREMIGHKDLRMTDRYTHLTDMRKRKKQADLAQFYEQNGMIKS